MVKLVIETLNLLEAEKVIIQTAMNKAGGSMNRAAKMCGITRHILKRKLIKHDIANKKSEVILNYFEENKDRFIKFDEIMDIFHNLSVAVITKTIELGLKNKQIENHRFDRQSWKWNTEKCES